MCMSTCSEQEPQSDDCVTLDAIGRFGFKTPLDSVREPSENGWTLLSNTEDLYAEGPTFAYAVADPEETLEDIYEDYVCCDESDLHGSGMDLKRWFLGNVTVLGRREL